MQDVDLILPFTFKHPTPDGNWAELTLPVEDGWIPLRPIVSAMGLKWETQRAGLVRSNHVRQVKMRGWSGLPPLCSHAEHIGDYLNRLSVNRVKYPRLVEYFQQFFQVSLDAYLTNLKAEVRMDDIPPIFDSHLLSDSDTEELLKALPIIHIDTPATNADHLRSDLVKVGVRDYNELQYLCRNLGVVILKPNPENPGGIPLKRTVMIATYERGDLVKAASAGYYPIPEFFRRFPNLYCRQLQTVGRFSRDVEGSVIEGVFESAAAGGAPWFGDEFAANIKKLVNIHETVEDKSLRNELVEAFRRGQSLNDSLLDTSGEELF